MNHYAVIHCDKGSIMRLFLHRFPILGTLYFFALICVVIAGAERAHATTLTVTSTADSGVGSLRDAIAAASDGDTIQFDAALNGQTITLTSAELVIDKGITLSGPGPDMLAVSRDSNASNFRIFHVTPGHTVIIEGVTVSGGHGDGEGGGVLNEQATLIIDNCTVQSNSTEAITGGAIANVGEQSSAIMTIVNSTVSNNSVTGNAGGIINSGTLTISNSTVSNNTASAVFPAIFGMGGGISNGGMLEVSQSMISGNTAGVGGGGISNGGTVLITDSTISGNLAGSLFQGIGYGAGVSNQGQGTVTIRNSTVSDNTVISEDGGGGGIVSGGTNATLEITNSTISGNFANRAGGGISTGGTVTITNSTLSGNRTNGDGGGIFNGGPLEIGNTILNAGAAGANIFNDGGTITSLGHNLSSDDGGGFLTAIGDQINTDPILGPLQDNGGLTFTHGLLTGSVALDAGDPNFTPPPLYDQRGPGYHRVFNGRIDIGSLEVQPAPTPTPTPTATPTPAPSPAQALNISTRLRVETGSNVLIGGFIITGNAPKNVAVRGIGPSLAAFGISDFLADPTLELRAANGALLAQNDDWQDDPGQAAQLTNLGLALQHPNESGLVTTLQPGASYTAILAGNNGGTGVGLVEIYDANSAADSQLANISTRGFVQTGNNVMIGGFILGGSSSNTQVAVRGIGPSLAQIGLNPVLADPTLELRDGNGALLISNDDWQDDPASASQLAFHGLAPQDANESGIFALLPPGAFTAILAGNNGGTGIGLVEVYNLQ